MRILIFYFSLDSYPASQHYLVLILEHGGTDLENAKIEDWDAARAVLFQVVVALALAEWVCIIFFLSFLFNLAFTFFLMLYPNSIKCITCF